jgi:PTS system mannose-specific IIA component
VVTHGLLAQELVSASIKIIGEGDGLKAISIGWNDDVDQAREKIKEGIEKVDRGEGVIILTDMFGGTPTNMCLPFLKADKVEIVTGVNLPMVIKTMNLAGKEELQSLAEQVRTKGRSSINVATDILHRDNRKN